MTFEENLIAHFPTRTITDVFSEGGGPWTGGVAYAHYKATVDSVVFEYNFDTPEEIDGRDFPDLEAYVIEQIENYFE